jgi:hypothetical protein
MCGTVLVSRMSCPLRRCHQRSGSERLRAARAKSPTARTKTKTRRVERKRACEVPLGSGAKHTANSLGIANKSRHPIRKLHSGTASCRENHWGESCSSKPKTCRPRGLVIGITLGRERGPFRDASEPVPAPFRWITKSQFLDGQAPTSVAVGEAVMKSCFCCSNGELIPNVGAIMQLAHAGFPD